MKTGKSLCIIFAAAGTVWVSSQLFCAADDGQLGFKETGANELSFDTGVVSGTLTKDGTGEGLKGIKFIDGNVPIDLNHGLLCPYRFLTPQRRYGFGSWEWPRSGRVLANGAAQLLWGSAPDRPFAFSTVYRWKSADTLDFTVFFSPQARLDKFELFLGSYFDKFTTGKAYVADAQNGAPGLIEVRSNKGEIRLFPANDEVLPMIKDGRWRFPPYPMNMVIQPPLANPLGVRTQPESQVSVVFMSPPSDCFAMSMWTRGWSQCGYYLSLFGRDAKPGQLLVAHARLVFGKNISDSQTLKKYEEYLAEMKGNPEESLLTASETEAMQKVFAAPPSEANAVKPPDWLSSKLPEPDADGWMRLFDGKHLYGCKPSPADLEARKITLDHGSLRLDSTALRFNLNCRDIDVRARVKRLNGSSNIDIRWSNSKKGWKGYPTWFNGGDSFGVGKQDEKGWKMLLDAHSDQKHDDFFDMEVSAIGETVTLKADGETIGSVHDNSVRDGGFGILGHKGTTFVESLEVRILDKQPSNAGL